MRIPGATAYMEALQDPRSCFSDPELAAASPVLGPLGLPRAVSGSVAVVFRVDGTGGRSWAVRCFVRPFDGQRARYEAVRAHLSGLASPWRVGFDLQPCGISIDGEWWPVLKMDWAAGEPLLAYVERHLWDGAALGYLATRVAGLADRLRRDGVAHGDLQHGNILVAPGGDLRLVDYDGMFVPAMAGWAGSERGHRNYQHPGRLVGDFGPHLDAFPAWVIYTALAALAVDPLLWGRLDGGEEGLLLRQHDLEQPDRSAALAAMEASDGAGVPELARLLRSFLAGRPEDVPPLSAGLAPPLPAPSLPAPSFPAPSLPASSFQGPSLPAAASSVVAGSRAVAMAATGPVGRSQAGGAPSSPLPLSAHDARAPVDSRRSLFDALTAPPPASDGTAATAGPVGPAPGLLPGDLRAPRIALAAGVASTALVLAVAVAGGAPWLLAVAASLAVAGATGARLHQLFRHPSGTAAADRVDPGLDRRRRTVGAATRAVSELLRAREEVAAAEADAARRADRDLATLRAQEEQELRAVDVALEATLAGIGERERAVAAAERQARVDGLVELQAGVVDAQLAQHSLVSAAPAVHHAVVQRLALDGVRTAADFTDVVFEKAGAVVVCRDGRRLLVGALDQTQAAAMLAWRRRAAGVAQLKVPAALPRERVAAIQASSAGPRAALAAEAEAARADARRRAESVRSAWQDRVEAVGDRRKTAEADAARRRVDLDRDLVRAHKDVTEAEWHLAHHHGGQAQPADLGPVRYLRQVLAVGPLATIVGGVRPARPVRR